MSNAEEESDSPTEPVFKRRPPPTASTAPQFARSEAPASNEDPQPAGTAPGDRPPDGYTSSSEGRQSVALEGVRDTAAAVDRIGFEPYVTALATFLLSARTIPPLTLSVEGRWGSGKTSIMRQLEAAVRPSPQMKKISLSARVRRVLTIGQGVQPRTVWFNAWRHQKEDELWATFALQFLRQVKHQTPMWKRVAASGRLFAIRYRWVGGGWDLFKAVSSATALFGFVLASSFYLYRQGGSRLAAAVASGLASTPNSRSTFVTSALLIGGTYAAVVAGCLQIVRSIGGLVGNPFEVQLSKHINAPDYDGKSGFVEQFHRDFNDIVACYAFGKRDKIFIFIDDLDRCDPVRAAEVMQAINLLVGDNEHLVFVIGMDRSKVAAGIALRFHEVVPYLAATGPGPATVGDAIEYAYSYLEKFIQVPFRVPRCEGAGFNRLIETLTGFATPVPAPSASLAARRRETLELAVDGDSVIVSQMLAMVAPALSYNPRRLKQFLNMFRLTAYIARETGLLFRTVSLPQVAKFVAIDLRWPDFWDEVAESGDTAVREPSSGRWTGKPELGNLIKHISAGSDETECLLSGDVVRALRDIALTAHPRSEVAPSAATQSDFPPAPVNSAAATPPVPA